MSTQKEYRIAVIPGDGIGKEVMPEGLRVLKAAAKKYRVKLHFDHFDFSSYDYYEKHGQMMPDDWKARSGPIVVGVSAGASHDEATFALNRLDNEAREIACPDRLFEVADGASGGIRATESVVERI